MHLKARLEHFKTTFSCAGEEQRRSAAAPCTCTSKCCSVWSCFNGQTRTSLNAHTSLDVHVHSTGQRQKTNTKEKRASAASPRRPVHVGERRGHMKRSISDMRNSVSHVSRGELSSVTDELNGPFCSCGNVRRLHPLPAPWSEGTDFHQTAERAKVPLRAVR